MHLGKQSTLENGAIFIAERVSLALPVCAAVLFFLVMANLLKTSFTDPGIIPRATNKEVIEQERLFKIGVKMPKNWLNFPTKGAGIRSDKKRSRSLPSEESGVAEWLVS
ncbi:unnamed protein product [Bursaphelenchus xylophilus]|uniref:(pine wood nematode) hypothetical protein n=1 Tax=Bursaphelenchus xylophilus TaxID=6326 RepID=A0A7I8XGJ6_BURXY|nr:unnamed protein product [Bursaphelenchus xylophilus]CAG9081729.1 unnamed protein product [Bursaphelenchus xylophilus]